MPARTLTQTKLHPCQAIGCVEVLPAERLFCDRHAAMLQSDLALLLDKKHRPGHAASQLFTKLLKRAQQEILFAQTAGYRTPRDGSFEW